MMRGRLTRQRQRGSMALETALWLPILFTLFMGTAEIARVTYTYYTLQKTLNTVGRMLSAQPNINFCDPYDPTVLQIKQVAILSVGAFQGGTLGGSRGLVEGLTPEMIEVRIQRYSRQTGTVVDCECSATPEGCDAAGGARGPDYLAISIPDGYPMRLRIPGVPTDPIPLRPHILVPYTGL